MAMEFAPTDDIDEIVRRLEAASVATLEGALRENGGCGPPTMHIIVEHWDWPYLGFVQTRPFYRGRDAEQAVWKMGLLPAAMLATRLLITWEHADLSLALELPSAPTASNALVTLDADRDGGHTVRVHPFVMWIDPPTASTSSGSAVPEWGPVESVVDGPIPAPLVELLECWRAGVSPQQLAGIYEHMVAAGYTVQLYTRRRAPTA